jgi:uncharacterized membrane protein YvbJ
MVGLSRQEKNMNSGSLSNCPKCSSPTSTEALECSACGILFSKWQEREENVTTGNLSRYTIANATSSEFNWTILAIVVGVVILFFLFVQYNQ